MKTFFIGVLLLPLSFLAKGEEIVTYQVHSEISGKTDINVICSEINGNLTYKTVTNAIELKALNQFTDESISKEVVFKVDGASIIAGVSTVVGEIENEPSLNEVESAKNNCLKKLSEFKSKFPGVVIPSSFAPIIKNTNYTMRNSLEIEKRVGNYSKCSGYTDDVSFHEELFDLTGTKRNLTGFRLYADGEEIDLFEIRENKPIECQNIGSVVGGSIYSVISLAGAIIPLTQKALRTMLGIE